MIAVILASVIVLLAVVFLLIHIIWFNDLKCKFWKHCKLYRNGMDTCDKTGGSYYDDGAPAGCYRDLELNKQKSTYWLD